MMSLRQYVIRIKGTWLALLNTDIFPYFLLCLVKEPSVEQSNSTVSTHSYCNEIKCRMND